MSNKIIEGFKLYFPFIFKHAITYKEVSDYDLLVQLDDGSQIMYDDLVRTIRNLPKDPNNMTDQESRREFGVRLRKMMMRKNTTQNELAERTGIQQSLISNYLNGKNSPSFYNVDKIARALRCSTDDLRYTEYED